MTRSTTPIGLITSVLASAATLLATGLLVPAAHAQPEIVLPEAVLDIGAVARGEAATAQFQIENQGDAPLVIRDIRSNCACAAPEMPDPISPGSSGVLRVEVETELLSGPSSAVLTLTTNDPENPTVRLTVKLDSRNSLAAQPGAFRYIVHRHFPGDGRITQTVFATDGEEFEITEIEPPFPELRIEGPRPAEEEERESQITGSQWAIDGYLDNSRRVGPLTGFVRVHTDHPKQKVIPIPVSGFVRPVVALTPEEFEFGSFTPPENGTYLDVHLKHFATEPMTLGEMSVDVEGFRVEPVVVEEGRTWYVRATATADAPAGPFRGTVTIKTSSVYNPEITIPISGTVVAEE